MNKKKWLTVVIVLTSVLLVTGGIYLGLAGYYLERFCYGTWINGVYCTGKTVDEVNAELVMLATYDKITIIDRNNSQYEVALEEIEYGMDYTGALKEIKGGQKEFEWIRYYFTEQNFDVMPVVTFSEEKLADILYKADFMKKEVLAVGNRPEIVLEEDGAAVLIKGETGIVTHNKATVGSNPHITLQCVKAQMACQMEVLRSIDWSKLDARISCIHNGVHHVGQFHLVSQKAKKAKEDD